MTPISRVRRVRRFQSRPWLRSIAHCPSRAPQADPPRSAQWPQAAHTPSGNGRCSAPVPAGSTFPARRRRRSRSQVRSCSSGTRLINIPNRGYVGTGNDLMIPGFVVSPEGPKTFLIRAVGPTLVNWGVTGVLSDPQLAIHRREVNSPTDQLILTNDNWGGNSDATDVAATASRVFAFALPGGSRDDGRCSRRGGARGAAHEGAIPGFSLEEGTLRDHASVIA